MAQSWLSWLSAKLFGYNKPFNFVGKFKSLKCNYINQYNQLKIWITNLE